MVLWAVVNFSFLQNYFNIKTVLNVGIRYSQINLLIIAFKELRVVSH